MAALKQENEALKQEQLQNARQIEALQKQLAAQQAEQKRFREMMSTNFDLLEQSVALTLSKSIENGGGRAPATAQAAPASKPSVSASKTPIAAPAPVMAPSAAKPTAEEVSAPQEAPEAVKPAPMDVAAPKAIGQAPAANQGVWITRDPKAQAAGQPAPSAATARTTPQAAAQKPAQGSAAKVAVPAAAAAQPAAYHDPDLTPPKSPKNLTANRAAKALYERGFALYANKQYDQAALVYQNFLSRYPEDIYSDNAQFWIGESYLHLDKLADAETAYRKVLREYEHKNSLEGYKTPEAIYRLGTLASKRSDTAKARYYFSNVAQRFPESSAGRKAQRELEGKPHTTALSEADDEKYGG
jgi:tol-pal system protein YbgF